MSENTGEKELQGQGEQNQVSANVTDKELEQLWEKLERFEQGINLPHIKLTSVEKHEFEQYLTFDRTAWEKTSKEDCVYICIFLSQYAYKLKHAYNRQWAQLKFLEKTYTNIGRARSSNYTGNWECQFQKAVAGDSHLSKLQQHCLEIEARCNCIKDMSEQVKHLSDSIKSIQYIRKDQD